MRTLALVWILVFQLSGAVVIDRIAVVVDRHVIKTSDIDRDLRVTEFLNRQPLKLDATERKAAAERLIDQEIIRTELAAGGYPRARDTDAEALLSSVRKDRFAGADARLRQELLRYGVPEETLRAQLLWQLTVLKFIDERFRTAVLVTDEDVRAYYEGHRSEFRNTLEAETPAIRKTLEGEQINKQFEDWLAAARKRTTVRYHEEAFQ